MRPTREQLHMTMAAMWASRSVCKRLQVGCVITTSDLRQVLSIGYNGPARQLPHEQCNGIPGQCLCLHAETNAIVLATQTIVGATVFLTHMPCVMCAQLMLQAGIRTVWYWNAYRDRSGVDLLERTSVTIAQQNPLEMCMDLEAGFSFSM